MRRGREGGRERGREGEKKGNVEKNLKLLFLSSLSFSLSLSLSPSLASFSLDFHIRPFCVCMFLAWPSSALAFLFSRSLSASLPLSAFFLCFQWLCLRSFSLPLSTQRRPQPHSFSLTLRLFHRLCALCVCARRVPLISQPRRSSRLCFHSPSVPYSNSPYYLPSLSHTHTPLYSGCLPFSRLEEHDGRFVHTPTHTTTHTLSPSFRRPHRLSPAESAGFQQRPPCHAAALWSAARRPGNRE